MSVKVSARLNRLRSVLNEWVVDGFFGEASRLVFGNSAGLRYNLASGVKGRRTAVPTCPDVERLHRDGYVLTDIAYDRQLIDGIIGRFQHLIDDPGHSRANSRYSRELKDPVRSIPEFRCLLDERVRRLLHEYFGSSFRVVETQAFRTFPIPEADRGTEAYSNFWHCDSYPVSWVKVYVFLSDWTPASGGTEILPIPRTKKIMRSGYVNRYFSLGGQERLARMTEDHVSVVGPAGSIFIFNPQRCLHRAGVPTDGRQRDAMMFFLAGSNDSEAGPNGETVDPRESR